MKDETKIKLKLKNKMRNHRGEEVIILLESDNELMFITEEKFDKLFGEATSEPDEDSYVAKLKSMDKDNKLGYKAFFESL